MKILHVMKSEKFTRSVSEFYDIFFNNGEHEICYINQEGGESLISDKIALTQKELFLTKNFIKDSMALRKMFLGYDYVVMHSYQFEGSVKIFLYMNRDILKKLVWIEWGADLYLWHVDKNKLKYRIKNMINRSIRTSCDSMVGIFAPDCDYYKKNFPDSKIKVYYAPYAGAHIPEEYLHYSEASRLSQSVSNGETIYIQIGHSATPAVNHIQCLDALSKFSDEDIKILMPLNYGDMEYADKVQKYAEEKFPGKVDCLRKFLQKDEYFRLINRVDIAIFNTHRQIALGNIKRMLFRNVKMYLPKGSIMYDYFIAEGLPIQKFEDIVNTDFSEFVTEVKTEDKERFGNFISSLSDMESKVKLWTGIYDDLRERVKN